MFNAIICGLLPLLCAVPHIQARPVLYTPSPTSNVSVMTQTISSATSTEVTVKTSDNATSTTYTLRAPYGVRSVIVTKNGQTYATTTPLTQTDIEQMQRQAEQEQAHIQQQMDQMIQDQQKLFDDIRSGF